MKALKLKHSIFFKLIIILAVSGVLINITVIFFSQRIMDIGGHRPAYNSLMNYAQYIITDIGNPPQKNKAELIALSNNIIISLSNTNSVWSAGGESKFLQSSDRKCRMLHRWDHNIWAGRWKNYLILQIHSNGSTWTFERNLHGDFEVQPGWLAAALSILALILSLAYLSIRSILKPIRRLNIAVDHLSRGNLNYRVEESNANDELSRLTSSFNEMAARISEMIKNREQLLLDVSHELRSPLTRMKLALEFLNESREKESLAQDINELDLMLTELLETERMKSPGGKLQYEKLNVSGVFSDLAAEFAGRSPGVKFETVETLFVFADAKRLTLMLRNLIENALKYSMPESPLVQINARREENQTVITIKDSGIGIAASELERIFEPFYRVDKSRSKNTGGFGLGLAICKKITEAHGGRIEITSAVGKGTEVSLYLAAA